MPIMTSTEVARQHLNRLVSNERILVAEIRRLESGLAAVREQIAKERRALAGGPAAGDPSTGQRAA